MKPYNWKGSNNVPNNIKKIWTETKLNASAKPFSPKKKLNASAKNFKPKKKSYANTLKKKRN